MDGVGSVCTELTVWEGKTMKTAVKHCVSSAYQIGTDGGVEGRRGPSPASYPIQLNRVTLFVALLGHNRCALTFEHQLVEDEAGICQDKFPAVCVFARHRAWR